MNEQDGEVTRELRWASNRNWSNCQTCGHRYSEGEIRNEGYDYDGKPLIVCENCVDGLRATAQRVVFTDRCYKTPVGSCVLWRYMNFAKYTNLLATSHLHFARLDSLEDQFEGAKGFLANRDKWDDFYREFLRTAVSNPPCGTSANKSPEEIHQESESLLLSLRDASERERLSTFVNCWHASEHESEAMWRLYGSSAPFTLAIRTTVSKLEESLAFDPDIQVGHVRYIDLKSQIVGLNTAVWRKHISYVHEQEVRAVVRSRQEPNGARSLPCDTGKLIDKVVVSPNSPDWFIATADAVNEQFGLKKKVATSELISTPFY